MGMARVSFPDERKREVGSREGRGKQRASETERGGEGEGQREREREIFTRKIIEWCSVMVNPIVGSRSIDDRIGKKIVSSYVASCQPLWNHEKRGRERKKDAKSVGLSDTGKSHCPLVCHPRLRRGRS